MSKITKRLSHGEVLIHKGGYSNCHTDYIYGLPGEPQLNKPHELVFPLNIWSGQFGGNLSTSLKSLFNWIR